MRVIIPPTGNEIDHDAQDDLARRWSSAPVTCSPGRPRSRARELHDDRDAHGRELLVPRADVGRQLRAVPPGAPVRPRRRPARCRPTPGRSGSSPTCDPGRVQRRCPMTAPMVKAENVHKSFGHVEVLKGIDLEVAPREVFCLLGPSGSGQVDLPALHQPPREGRRRPALRRRRARRLPAGTATSCYELREQEVAAQRRDIGMVFQRFNLFPHMTALQNVMEAPLRVRRESKAVARDARREAARPGRPRPTRAAATRRSSPAASSSAWRSPARWRWSRS